MLDRPIALLRLEGLAMLAGAIALYARLDGTWWWIPVLLLVPDISWVGYLAGPRIGAMVYNAAHTTALPTILGIVGLVTDATAVMLLALIWFIHIGVDRLAGYGLKYLDQFGHTHLGLKGRAAHPATTVATATMDASADRAS